MRRRRSLMQRTWDEWPRGRLARAGQEAGTPKPIAPVRRPMSGLVGAFIVPGYPHPLQVPEANAAYGRIRDAYAAVRARIDELQPDVILLYSTQWLSVIGHQVQTRREPTFRHVDQEFHALGPIEYTFRMDPAFGDAYVEAGRKRGLEMRGVDYDGFPIDTGSVVALKLLNGDNAYPASIVSCNMYADRAETIVLGKAARDAAAATGKRVVAIGVTALSNRIHTAPIDLADDRIHSQKDDEWNRKYLEILGEGRLEDAAQLARTFSDQASGDQRMKAIWWLNAVGGQSNAFDGEVLAYEAIVGTGAAVVALTPTAKAAKEAEFDEDDAEVYLGDRNVLGGANLFEAADGVDIALQGQDLDAVRAQRLGITDEAPQAGTVAVRAPRPAKSGAVQSASAPKPVGAYPHARRVGDMLYLSGLGPRDPKDNSVPGGPVWDEDGNEQEYDIHAQTEAVIRNMKTVLASAGATIDDVVDCTCYLINMQRDFAGFNEVYAKHFGDVQATRTTLEINRLPTPIAVEFKVVAQAPDST